MSNLLFNTMIGYLLQILPFVILIVSFYLFFYRRNKKSGPLNCLTYEMVKLMLVCYFSGLIALVWVPNNFWAYIWFYFLYGYPGPDIGTMFSGEFDLMPSILLCMQGKLTLGSWVRAMSLGNVAVYIPLGILMPAMWQKRIYLKTVIFGTIVSLVTELGQPIFGRSFDVDDIILNTLGTVIGALFVVLVRVSCVLIKRVACNEVKQ